jgi:peptidoglycan LD-endopeptidase CwlK
MPKYSKKSRKNLDSADPDLQKIFEFVLPYIDHTIIYGYRGQEDQDKAYDGGHSSKPWPTSLHNKIPSLAVDAAPYDHTKGGTDWRTDKELLDAINDNRIDEALDIVENIKQWYEFSGFVQGVAANMGVDIEWGGHWKNLVDLAHFQLREKK